MRIATRPLAAGRTHVAAQPRERHPAARGASRLTAALLMAAAMAAVVSVRLLPLQLVGLNSGSRADSTYTGTDGRTHVYLGDYDSYYWLRAAQRYLDTGSVCDRMVDGLCHDDYTLAPVGAYVIYERSPHVLAIAWLHRVLRLVRPGWPLSASAFLVPVLIGMAGVVPAFALGSRLAGPIAGFSAALVIGLNPLFLERSIGGDNDVWNVVLPLFIMWAAVSILSRPRPWGRLLAAVTATLLAAVHALIWRGWIFAFAIAVVGVLVAAAVTSCRALLRPLRSQRRRVAAALWVCVPAVVLLIAFVSSGHVRQLFDAATAALAPMPATAGAWPSGFATVGELSKPFEQNVAAAMGGVPAFFIGWLGLLFLLLPRRQWRQPHYAILICGNFLYAYLVAQNGQRPLILLFLLALPLAVALTLSVADRDRSEHPDSVIGLPIILWFVAGLFVAFAGTRFTMLLVPPFGVAFGVALGRCSEWCRDNRGELPAPLPQMPVLLALAPCLLLLPPLLAGYRVATGYVPAIDDAWWDTLVHVRQATAPQAIVTTWWPYGYWTEYVAARRATIDGGSLPAHAPYWVAQALYAEDERDAVGLLRMLDCGSDTSPGADQDSGAFAQLLRTGIADNAARVLLRDLIRRPRREADDMLVRRGISSTARDHILAASHCVPPPGVLILTSRMLAQPGWKSLGTWDFATGRPTPEYMLTPNWKACAAGSDPAELICPIDIVRGAARLEAFVYTRDHAAAGRLRWRTLGGDASLRPPAAVVVANPDHLDTDTVVGNINEPAVLVDSASDRVLIGSVALLRSTFAQLMFLDGRYSHRFRKLDDRTGVNDERVVAWTIGWPQEDSDSGSPP